MPAALFPSDHVTPLDASAFADVLSAAV